MAAPSSTTWGSTATSNGNQQGCIGVNITFSDNDTSRTVNAGVWYWSKWKCNDNGNTFKYGWSSYPNTTIGSVSINSPSNTDWSTQNQKYIGSYSQTFSREGSAYQGDFSATFSGIEWGGGSGGVYVKFDIPAKESYIITYNGNGGSYVPSAQTRWKNESITISSTVPQKQGHTFGGWRSTLTGRIYQPGDLYPNASVNGNDTLTAIWSATSCDVVYSANTSDHVSNMPTTQTKVYGVDLKLSTQIPSRSGYTFAGWGTSSGSTVASYMPGDTYSVEKSLNLYAIWTLNYEKPRISNLVAYRCTSEGQASDSGTYAKVTFTWNTDANVTTIKVGYRQYGQGNYTYTSLSTYNKTTSGNESAIIGQDYYGNGSLLLDPSYEIKVVVCDNKDSVGSSSTTTIGGNVYTVDFLNGGKGVAFGKVAEKQNAVEIAPIWDLYVKGQSLSNYVSSIISNSVKTILNSVYPIGSIYMSVSPTNPQELFGGTWIRWGEGRVPVGVDSSQTEFDYSEKTGGEKTHTLTESEMPSHSGHIAPPESNRNGNFYGLLNSSKMELHGSTGRGWDVQFGNEIVPASQTAGLGQSHNNLQPYITCYMWKRTA